MYHFKTLSLVWLVVLSSFTVFVPFTSYAEEQQPDGKTSGTFVGCKQQLASIPREDAEEVAYYGVIAAVRHGDAEVLSDFMRCIPERSRNEESVFREIGRALNRDLLDVVRARYSEMYQSEFRRYYAQAEARDGELLNELTPKISCDLTTILAAAAIAADNAGHKANAGKLARRAWDNWNSCIPADRSKLWLTDLASACARAEMWQETEALLVAEAPNYPPEFPMVVRAVARQQLSTNRVKDAVTTVSAHLAKHDAEFLHFELVHELIDNGKLDRAIEYSHVHGVEGVNEAIAEELARTGRIDDASKLMGEMTALHKIDWQVMSAGDFLKKGMKARSSAILSAALSDLEAIPRPMSAGDAIQISKTHLRALPYALELDDTEATHQILEALTEYVALGNIDSPPISPSIVVPAELYAKTAVVLAEYGRAVGADLFFRKAWQQEKHSYYSRQLLVVTMASAGRFLVCWELVNESGDRNLRLLAAYCQGFWKRRAGQRQTTFDSVPKVSGDSDVALELCQRLGSISGEKSDTFEFPGFFRRADTWFFEDSPER